MNKKYLNRYSIHTMFTVTNEKEVQPVGCVLPNTLVLGDCLEVMKYIPDGSIDAIITDPPYGTRRSAKPRLGRAAYEFS